MLSNSILVKGAIASVVVGALTYYFFVHKRKPLSIVQALANSHTKSSKDMVDQLLSMILYFKKNHHWFNFFTMY